MHIAESYSLVSGQKIGKMKLVESFFPLPFSKYIILQPYSKPSKSYSLWQDVVDAILPICKQAGIAIVQIGAKNEKQLRGTYFIAGQTSLRQVWYLIRNCELFLGTDSFGAHMAGALNKLLVVLYSNNYTECVKPFFGENARQILLEPDRGKDKPSFSFTEHPKSIDKIGPEKIFNAVCQLLFADAHKDATTTEFTGSLYPTLLIESVPNQVVNPLEFGCDAVISRMDYEFNEDCLVEQLKRSKVCIATNKPINPNILKGLRPNVKEISYRIEKNGTEKYEADFIDLMRQLNIPHFVSTSLEGENLRAMKLKLLDYGLINTHSHIDRNQVQKLKEITTPLYYRTGKFTLSQGRIFPSKAAWIENKPVDSIEQKFQPIIWSDDFYKEFEHFRICSGPKS